MDDRIEKIEKQIRQSKHPFCMFECWVPNIVQKIVLMDIELLSSKTHVAQGGVAISMFSVYPDWPNRKNVLTDSQAIRIGEAIGDEKNLFRSGRFTFPNFVIKGDFECERSINVRHGLNFFSTKCDIIVTGVDDENKV